MAIPICQGIAAAREIMAAAFTAITALITHAMITVTTVTPVATVTAIILAPAMLLVR
jgi:hypothetical protein